MENVQCETYQWHMQKNANKICLNWMHIKTQKENGNSIRCRVIYVYVFGISYICVQQRVSEREKLGKWEGAAEKLRSNALHWGHVLRGKKNPQTQTKTQANTHTNTKTWNLKENLHINYQAFIFYLLLATCHSVLHRCKPFDLWVCTTFIWLEKTQFISINFKWKLEYNNFDIRGKRNRDSPKLKTCQIYRDKIRITNNSSKLEYGWLKVWPVFSNLPTNDRNQSICFCGRFSSIHTAGYWRSKHLIVSLVVSHRLFDFSVGMMFA